MYVFIYTYIFSFSFQNYRTYGDTITGIAINLCGLDGYNYISKFKIFQILFSINFQNYYE